MHACDIFKFNLLENVNDRIGSFRLNVFQRGFRSKHHFITLDYISTRFATRENYSKEKH